MPKLLLILTMLVAIGCGTQPTPPMDSEPKAVTAVTLADWTQTGYSRQSSRTAIEDIGVIGASHLFIIVTAYQVSATASQLRTDVVLTPSRQAVRQALSWAGDAGLAGAIKLHIISEDGAPTGDVRPANPTLWFDSYWQFLQPWAQLAEVAGTPLFVLGTEFDGTLEYGDLWRELIRKARQIYSGALVYAASWDNADRVPFWRDLDYVGVDAFFPVTQRNNPSRAEILSGWQPWLQHLEDLHNRTGKQLLLTEIGYRSIDGAGIHPYRFDNPGSVDLQEQADLYWAALEAIKDAGFIDGIAWWNWLASGAGGPNDRDYTPFGKPAEQVLVDAWRGPAL